MRKITPEKLKKILEDHKLWLITNKEKGKRADLNKTNLAGTKLKKANLSGADISKADLSKADLRGAKLSEADLGKANLNKADLSKADLKEACLSGADLHGADLSEASFNEADLWGANLGEANLKGTNLKKSYLRKANLKEACLREANLSEANLSEIDLRGVDLRGADLSGADLSKADLGEADLRGVNLCGADLLGADLRFGQFHYCNLSKAIITGIKTFGIGWGRCNIEGIVCEWFDKSENGDGSDICHPGKEEFEIFSQILEPEIIVAMEGTLDFELMSGLAGLTKIIQATKARINEVEQSSSGKATIIIKAEEEENLIPTAVILANSLIKDEKLDVNALSNDMGDLKKLVVNGKPLFDLLKDLPEMIDLSQHFYDGLAKIRNRFISQEINIRDEKIKVRRQNGKFYIDYCQSSNKPQIEDKTKGSGKDFVRDAGIAVSSGTVGAIAAEIVKHILTKI